MKNENFYKIFVVSSLSLVISINATISQADSRVNALPQAVDACGGLHYVLRKAFLSGNLLSQWSAKLNSHGKKNGGGLCGAVCMLNEDNLQRVFSGELPHPNMIEKLEEMDAYSQTNFGVPLSAGSWPWERVQLRRDLFGRRSSLILQEKAYYPMLIPSTAKVKDLKTEDLPTAHSLLAIRGKFPKDYLDPAGTKALQLNHVFILLKREGSRVWVADPRRIDQPYVGKLIESNNRLLLDIGPDISFAKEIVALEIME